MAIYVEGVEDSTFERTAAGGRGVYQGEPARVAVDGGMSSPRRTKAIIVRAAFELMGI